MTRLDVDMIDHARRRGYIRLDDGRVVTLISWGCRGHRDQMRVDDDGRRFTIPKTRCTETL